MGDSAFSWVSLDDTEKNLAPCADAGNMDGVSENSGRLFYGFHVESSRDFSGAIVEQGVNPTLIPSDAV